MKRWMIEDQAEEIARQSKRTNKSFFWKVVRPDGTSYKDYKRERVQNIFEREGGKLYAYTKNLYPIVLLIDWK